MKILLLLDYDAMRKALEFKLVAEGYTVSCAAKDSDAIDMLKQYDYDLLISDIMMPFVNGIEVLSTLRNVLRKQTPVIMLTSVGFENTMLEAFNLGADDFVTKPFSTNELVLRVGRLLSKKTQA